jgi:cell division protein FtsB
MTLPSRRTTTLSALGVLLLLLGASALDPEGLRRYRRLEAEVRRATAENREMARENARRRREVRALQGDPAALERAAREELGFVRPGEVIFKLDEGGRR